MKYSSNSKEVAQAMGAMVRQYRSGARSALNTVTRYAIEDVREEMRKRFDRPTPYVLRAVDGEFASGQSATVETAVKLRYPGGKGVDPNSVLQAEFEGGARNDKRMERALMRLGVLNTGWNVVPGTGIPDDKMDRYGNVKGSYIVQILAYFQAFSEQGYKANMKPKRIKQLARHGQTDKGFKTIKGVEYFISRGRGTFAGRGAQRATEHAGDRKRQEQHLPAGIWSRSGIHGSILKPVFMFVRRPIYRKAMDFDQVVMASAASNWEPVLAWKLEQSMKGALTQT
jgi:hypothetical protein